jgi:hypothetical protein
VGLLLSAVDVTGPWGWRWLLTDERSGDALADHTVALDPGAPEAEAFEDLYRFLRWRADPDRRVASEAELVAWVGAWAGAQVLGERVGRAIVAAAPVTVRVQVPAGAEFLAFRPLELAHVDGVPLAGRGDVTLVYDLPGACGAGAAKEPVGGALRMLAVFSLPAVGQPLGLRRERYGLTQLVRRVASKAGRRVELEVAQYGVTREVLRDLAEDGDGWDVLHLSGHGGAGQFLLEKPDGSPDPVSTEELVELLAPARWRVKLAVVSACQSAAATTAESLRWLGLEEQAKLLETEAAGEAAGAQAAQVGVARAVAERLGCAVVAMRYPVIDDFAVDFADALYDRVFRQRQTLDRAVAAAVRAAARVPASAACPALSVGTPAVFGASAAGLSLAPPVGAPELDPAGMVMAGFPVEPERFVGRSGPMAAASAALAAGSGVTGVVFHGMAGAGKTACAVELAYRHQRAFAAHAFWSAPTDPDQFGVALGGLAVALESQLRGYGFAMVDKIGTLADLERFQPRLTALLRENGLLLVLDNLETLLTATGQWRDPRWGPLVAALTDHGGESRVVLTSRVRPAGLDAARVRVLAVNALSRDESLLLARELPNLRALLGADAGGTLRQAQGGGDRELALRVLTLVQGHPKLLELADAAAADPARLAAGLDAAAAAVEGAALGAFLTGGNSALEAGQFLATLTAWTQQATDALPEPARLLLQVLCRIEDTDRTSTVLEATWGNLWQRLGQPGQPPPVAEAVAPLLAGALVAADPPEPGRPEGPVGCRVHPGIAEAVHAHTPAHLTAAVDAVLAEWWTSLCRWAIGQEAAGKDTTGLVVAAGLAGAPYLLRFQDWNTASTLLEHALHRDGNNPATVQAAIPPLRRITEATNAPDHLRVLATALRAVDPVEAEALYRRAYQQATDGGDHRLAYPAAGHLLNLLIDRGRLSEALTLTEKTIEHTRLAGLGPWTQLGDQARRLQLRGRSGDHEQVLTDLPALRKQMADLPEQAAGNDLVSPWNVRELILDVGHTSARALERWEDALALNAEIATSERRRGAPATETARTRFNDYTPLLRLGRLPDVDRLLRECQQAFEAAGDIDMLGMVFGARRPGRQPPSPRHRRRTATHRATPELRPRRAAHRRSIAPQPRQLPHPRRREPPRATRPPPRRRPPRPPHRRHPPPG